MAQKPSITVSISPSGEINISTAGFSGKACQLATQELEKNLGITTSESLTREFYQNVQSDHKNSQ